MQGKFQDGSIIVCGVLGKDAEHKQVGEKNTHLTKFGVKVGEKPSAVVDEKPEAIWVNCDCWNNVAKAAMGLKKLDVVLCIGKLKITEKDGKTYKSLECEAVFKMGYSVVSTLSEAASTIPQDFEEILNDDGVPF